VQNFCWLASRYEIVLRRVVPTITKPDRIWFPGQQIRGQIYCWLITTFLSFPHSISKRQAYFLLGEEALGEWLRPMSPELSKNIAHLFWFFLESHLFDSGDKRGGFDPEQFRGPAWSYGQKTNQPLGVSKCESAPNRSQNRFFLPTNFLSPWKPSASLAQFDWWGISGSLRLRSWARSCGSPTTMGGPLVHIRDESVKLAFVRVQATWLDMVEIWTKMKRFWLLLPATTFWLSAFTTYINEIWHPTASLRTTPISTEIWRWETLE